MFELLNFQLHINYTRLNLLSAIKLPDVIIGK